MIMSGGLPLGRPSDYLVRHPAGRIQTVSWGPRPDTPPESAARREADLVGHPIRLRLWRRPGKAGRLLQDLRPATQKEMDRPARGTRRRAAPSLLPKTHEGTPRDGRGEQAEEDPRTEADGVGQDRSS